MSVQGRFDYYKDSVKIILENGILGIGADGWKDKRIVIQDYLDYANESHSYILEVFCEFGIVGFIAILYIIIFVFKTFLKLFKNQKLNVIETSIVVSLLTIIIHSCIDFDLSFMYMLIILFTLIAMIDKKEQTYNKLDIFIKVLTSIFIISSLYFNIKICINELKGEENPYSIEIIYENLKNDKNFSKNIDEIVKRRKYYSHVSMFSQIITDELTEDNCIKLFDVLKNEKDLLKNDAEKRIGEIEIYQNILTKVEKDTNKKNEIKNEILSEINITKDILNEQERCRLSLEKIANYNAELQKIQESILEME